MKIYLSDFIESNREEIHKKIKDMIRDLQGTNLCYTAYISREDGAFFTTKVPAGIIRYQCGAIKIWEETGIDEDLFDRNMDVWLDEYNCGEDYHDYIYGQEFVTLMDMVRDDEKTVFEEAVADYVSNHSERADKVTVEDFFEGRAPNEMYRDYLYHIISEVRNNHTDFQVYSDYYHKLYDEIFDFRWDGTWSPIKSQVDAAINIAIAISGCTMIEIED